MELQRKLITTLRENEVREVEPIIERINGLKELLMIATDAPMHNKIIDEISVLENQRDTWWKRIASQNHWDNYLSFDWGIDFISNQIWVIAPI